MDNSLKNEQIKPSARARGGVLAPHRKNTAEMQSVVMPVPKQVSIVMQQHIGAPCVPTVKKGDKVFVGTLIGDSDKFVSAPIHSSVSGEVAEITDIMLPSGQTAAAVVINTDGEQMRDDSLIAPVVENRDDFIKAVRASGMVGLGGAGFPTHVKLNPQQEVDTLVVNAAECEPYITADYREIMENSEDIMDGIYLMLNHLRLKKVVIVIEDNKPEAIKLLTQIAADNRDADDRVKVMKVSSRYPRGAEKVTVYVATGRKIPPAKLPADVGCIVMNVSSIASVARYIKTGIPLVSKRLTVDGSAIKNPQNVIVPIGTYINDVIEFCGGYKTAPKKVLMGGPMMGISLPADDMPVLKQNNAILALDEHEAYPKPLSACIRCGRCVKVCPMSLMPVKIEGHLKLNDVESLKSDGVLNCIECGCCAYECPAARPLVQVMRQAKTVVRK